MAIVVKCRKCGKAYKLADDKAGKRFKCRQCAAVVQIPEAAEEDWGDDEYEPQAPSLPPATVGKKGGAKKSSAGKKKQKTSSPVNPKVLIGAGAGLLLVVGLIVGGMAIFGGGGGDDDDAGVPPGQDETVAQADGQTPDAAGSDAGAEPGKQPPPDTGPEGKPKQPPAKSPASKKPAGAPKTGPPSAAPSKDELKHAVLTRRKLKKIGLAFHNFHDTWGAFTMPYSPQLNEFDKEGRTHLSWRVYLLPFLGEVPLYNQFKRDEPWDSPNNKPLAEKMPDIYRSPSGNTDNMTRFMLFTGKGTLFVPKKSTHMRNVADGTSYTLLVVEAGPDKAVPWSKPDDLVFDPQNPTAALGKIPEGGVHGVLCDGSAVTLKKSTPPEVLAALITNRGGERIAFDEYKVAIDETAVPNTPDGEPPKPAPEGPLHVAYLPDDGIGAVILNPQRFLNSEFVSSLPLDYFYDMMLKQAQFDPREIEQVIFLPLPPPETPVIVVRFTKAADKKQIASHVTQVGQEQASAGGRTYFRGQHQVALPRPAAKPGTPSYKLPPREYKTVSQAAYTPDPHTVVFATEEVMKQLLSRSAGKSPVAERVAALDLDRDIIAYIAVDQVSDTSSLQGLVEQAARKSFFLAAPDLSGLTANSNPTKAVSFSLDLSGEQLFAMTLEAKDAAGLQKLYQSTQAGHAKFNQQYPGFRKMFVEKWSPAAQAMTDKLVKGVTVRKEGDTVVVELKNPGGLPEFAKSVIVPAILSAQKAAETAEHRNDLKQIGLAFHNYHDTHRAFPVAPNPKHFDENGKPFLSWRVHILPFLDEYPLYNQFKLDEPWDSPHNKKLLAQMPKPYRLLDAPPDATTTSIMVFTGSGAPFGGKTSPTIRDFTDGTTNTLLAVEAGPDKAVPWTKPDDIVFDPQNPLAALGKIPPVGIRALFADGAVKTLKNINATTFKALITHQGREPVNPTKFR